MRWQVGDARVTRVVEIDAVSIGSFVLPDAVPARVLAIPWLQPHFADPKGLLRMSIHALVIESRGRRILVDTCVGNDKQRGVPDWHERTGPFLEDLAAAGFPAESIDTVLCTHMHVDHVGWNTRRVDGRWVPTFPNARYLFARAEWEHWSREPEDPRAGPVFADSVQPVFDAGLADLVEPDCQVTDEVRLEPTPGHTPGHVSVRIRSADAEAVITGDMMHHPCQLAVPDWSSAFDTDPDRARTTRRAFLERCADRPVLVVGTHFPTPTAGRVARDGDAYRLETGVPSDSTTGRAR